MFRSHTTPKIAILLAALWLAGPNRAEAEEPAAQDSTCLDLSVSVREIHQHLEAVLLEEAHLVALKAQRALDCQPEPVPPILLTALFGASGALELFQGDESAARQDFQHALTFSPTGGLDARYGDEALALFTEVQSQSLARQGARITLHGNIEAWLDGNKVVIGEPTDLRPGQHLLQWKEPDGPMTNHIVQLLPGDVRTGWLTGKPVDKRPVRAATGLSLLLAGGSLLGLGAQQVEKFENYPEEFRVYGDESPSAQGLERLKRRNHFLVISGGLVSVAGIGVAALALSPPETDNLALSIGGTW